ncbi:hypothetical protein [Aeoliella sp.]|uniref:hypothetical protein n=1 Tax=Aeoliella sp. TaxID=2795800 RepID=UPI003CCB808D
MKAGKRSGRRTAIVIAGAITLFLIACYLYGIRRASINGLFNDLQGARTSIEEQVAFEKLERKSRPIYGFVPYKLSFRPYDAQGKAVDSLGENWWESVAVLHIRVNNYELDHRVIDPENIAILMRE